MDLHLATWIKFSISCLPCKVNSTVIIFRFGSERLRDFTKVTLSGSLKSNVGLLISRLAFLLEFLFWFIYLFCFSHLGNFRDRLTLNSSASEGWITIAQWIRTCPVFKCHITSEDRTVGTVVGQRAYCQKWAHCHSGLEALKDKRRRNKPLRSL